MTNIHVLRMPDIRWSMIYSEIRLIPNPKILKSFTNKYMLHVENQLNMVLPLIRNLKPNVFLKMLIIGQRDLYV